MGDALFISFAGSYILHLPHGETPCGRVAPKGRRVGPSHVSACLMGGNPPKVGQGRG